MDPPFGRNPVNSNPEFKEETATALDPSQMGALSQPRPFLCPQCPKTFYRQRSLQLHMNVHFPDNPHVCPLCNKTWSNSYQLTAHLRSHTGEKLFKCPAVGCGRKFVRRDNLEHHMRSHTGEKVDKPICALCGASFTRTQGLKAHIRRFHNSEKKQHICVACGKVYVLLKDFNRHVKTHLPDDPQDCLICGKSCRNGHVLKEHLGRHGREGNYQCEHCLRTFKTHTILKIHTRNAHGGRKDIKNKYHVCSFCGLKWRSSSDLVTHLRTHTGEKPFKCTTCPKAFYTQRKLRAHLKIHTREKPEECPFCGRRFSWEGGLNRHLRTHTGEKPCKCDKCGMAFGDSASFKRHRLAIHPEEQRDEDPQTPTHTQVENQDPLGIPSDNEQRLSTKLDHDTNPESQEGETLVTLRSPEIGAAPEPRLFPCPNCAMSYRRQKSLNLHLRIHNPENSHICPLCNQVFPDDNQLTAHIRNHTGEKLFKCSADGCGKVCVSSAQLKRHLETHLPDDPQDCPICGKSCRNGLILKEHVQRHGWEGNYQCEHCAKNFKSIAYLKKHFRFHTGEKLFKCTRCAKAFMTNGKLQAHCKVHTGEKPEECQICGRKFASKTGLHRHIRTHTGEKPFKCDKCGRAFGDPSTLKMHKLAIHPEDRLEENQQTPSHMKEDGEDPLHIPSVEKQANHSSVETDPQKKETPSTSARPQFRDAPLLRPFLCPHCPKTYCLRKQLNVHLKVHSTDLPHVCPLCNKGWAFSYLLTAHMRSHTGEKLFKCTVDGCGKELARRRTLRIHMRIHTKEDSTHTPLKNNQGNDPSTQVLESSRQVNLGMGFHLRHLTVSVQRMKLKNVGGEVLELRSGGECWYMCSKCGRGNKSSSIDIRSHTLLCEVYQPTNPTMKLAKQFSDTCVLTVV